MRHILLQGLLYAYMLGIFGSQVIDRFLLREIWRLHPAWAEARQIPRYSGDRPRMWTWMKLVMGFNLELQITPLTRRQALASGVLYYLTFISLALLILVSML